MHYMSIMRRYEQIAEWPVTAKCRINESGRGRVAEWRSVTTRQFTTTERISGGKRGEGYSLMRVPLDLMTWADKN